MFSQPSLSGPAPANRADAWAVLDRFLHGLQTCQQLAQAIHPSLQTVQQSLGVDVCYWYSSSTERVGAIVGRRTPSPRSCQEFARRLLSAHPGESVLLWSPDPHQAQPASLSPHSALMIRFGKSNSWIVVLSFCPERKLQASDVNLVNLVKRVLLNYHAHAYVRVKELLTGLINCLTATIEAKDPYTAGHSERVAQIGAVLARHVGLSNAEVSDVYLSGLLHDVGKIGIPDVVLQKEGSLSPEEYALIQQHVLIGDRIVGSIRQFDGLRPGVRHHHEHYDGGGYPDGLRGEEIPRLARILAVADSCDAMMSPRRYRPARTPPMIDHIFLEGAGSQFDPEVIDHFMASRREIYPPIYQKGIMDSASEAIDHLVEAIGEGSLGSRCPLGTYESDDHLDD
jgi:HD-GYP domain-containing protein (c-di-GMP phosphodiesterase class II)